MTDDIPLPPHLEQFIRDQLAAGRFQSERDLIHTALHLLEDQSDSPEVESDWLKQEIDKGLCSRPTEPVTRQFWDHLRDRIRVNSRSDNDA